MIWRPVLVAHVALTLLAACGGAEIAPLPAPVAPAASSAAVAPAPHPTLSLIEAEPPAEAPAPTTPLPAFRGHFEAVPLPDGVPEILAVAGRDDRDVWMLAKGGPILQWDGVRTHAHGAPRCFTDSCCGRLFNCARAPAKCSAAAVARCPMGREDCAWAVRFDALRVTPDAVIVGASVDTGGLTQSRVESRLGRGDRWTCEQARPDGLIHAGAQELSAGGTTIRLESPAHLVNPLGGYGLVSGGRRLALPEAARGGYGGQVGLAARGPGDLWLWRDSWQQSEPPYLWHGNGLSWAPVEIGLTSLTSVWIGEQGSTWALGASEKDGDTLLLRREPDRGAWQGFPAPGATRALEAGGRAFWLVGKSVLYHWDGRALHAGQTPLDLEDEPGRAWLAPHGELWVVGAARGKKTTGAAFRVLPPEEAKP